MLASTDTADILSCDAMRSFWVSGQQLNLTAIANRCLGGMIEMNNKNHNPCKIMLFRIVYFMIMLEKHIYKASMITLDRLKYYAPLVQLD